MRNLFRFIGIVFVAIAFVSLFFIPAAWLRHPSEQATMATITVRDGWTVRDVAEALSSAHLASALGYRVYAVFDPSAARPKAGEYVISVGSNYRAIARLLALGPPRSEISMTVIEGWTIADISSALKERGTDVQVSDFYAERFAADHSFLRGLTSGTSLEGYLFPDTYRVWKDQLPDGLLTKQLTEFGDVTKGYADEATRQGRTFRDVVILASIVEKEVKNDADRAVVAGIFMNRLKDGMRLQSDATLNYVLKTGRSRLSADEIMSDSPYNTYTHDGLPPGPIGNPGKTSLEAALHPAETPYRYFLTDSSGKTYFARTLEEHARNRQKAFGN